MKKKSETTLHELAVKLCEGNVIFYNGHFLRAVSINTHWDVCNECELDSICTNNDGAINELCAYCDDYDNKYHILKLFHRFTQ